MTKDEREQSLLSARLACLALTPYAIGNSAVIVLSDPHREWIACLLEEFGRLDNKEQRQREAGSLGAEHGAKGGRPSKKRKKSAPVDRRASRE